MPPPLIRIGSAQFAAAGLLLTRTLIAAHVLGAEEFGVAVALALVAALIEALSSLGLAQFVMRDREGATPHSIGTAHAFQLGRGAIAALVLYGVAQPISQAMGVPEHVSAFRWLAIVPLINGVQHMAQHRALRDGIYRPLATVQIGSALSSLLVLLAVQDALPDHRAMLVALVVHAGVAALLSHLVADDVYRVRIDPVVARRIFVFAGPVLLNGVALAALANAEKAITGVLLGPSSLGSLALALSVTVGPATVFSKSLQAVYLPRLSKSGTDTPPLASMLKVALVTSCALWLGSQLLAEPFQKVMGSSYDGLAILLSLTAALAGLRILRGVATTLALARGRSFLPLLGNTPRLAAIPAVYVTLDAGHGLPTALGIVLGAEAIGLVLICGLLWRGTQAYRAC